MRACHGISIDNILQDDILQDIDIQDMIQAGLVGAL